MFLIPRKKYYFGILASTILFFTCTMFVLDSPDQQQKETESLSGNDWQTISMTVKERMLDNYQAKAINFEKERLPSTEQTLLVTDIAKIFTKEKYLLDTDQSKIIREKRQTYLDNNKHYTSLQSSFNCSKNHITLLVLIKSEAKSIARRKLVRATWGRYEDIKETHHFRKFFLIGNVKSKELQAFVSEEEKVFADIIRGDFADTFYNLSEKAEVGFEWSYKHCSFEYLLETDDDVFINIPLILQMINDHIFPKTDVYFGNVKENDSVIREKTGRFAKYSVSFEEYAGSKYQTYCSGGAYILSSDVIQKILPFIKQHPFILDDVYVGMLVFNAGVKPVRYEGFNLRDDYENPVCEYKSNLIAFHPAKKYSCMVKLFCSMLEDMLNSSFVQRNYLSDFSFSKCAK